MLLIIRTLFYFFIVYALSFSKDESLFRASSLVVWDSSSFDYSDSLRRKRAHQPLEKSMLTRLQVSGFKNLVDVDVRFGSFTCVAGANGVGKSNLFDAISFLSALADLPLIEAALSVRDEGGKTGDVRSLFHRVSDSYENEMTFDAEMIVPAEGEDDLGQKAEASITFLRYSLKLSYRADDRFRSLGSLELLKEELVHINLGDAPKNLLFPHRPDWRKSAVRGR